MSPELFLFISQLVKENDNFKVFEYTLYQDTMIKTFIKACKKPLPKDLITEPDDNRCFYDGEEFYLNERDYEILWDMMLKFYRLNEYVQDVNSPVTQETELIQEILMKKQIDKIESNYILIKINHILQKIKVMQDKDLGKAYPKIIKIIIDSYNLDNQFAYYLYHCLQNIFHTTFYKSTKVTTDGPVKSKDIMATQVFITIGNVILDYFIGLNPFLSAMRNYVDKSNDGFSITISEHHYDILNKLVTAIQEDNEAEQKKIYNKIMLSDDVENKDKKAAFTASNTFVKIINNYIISTCIKLFNLNKIKDANLCEKIKLIINKPDYVEFRSTEANVQLGACLVECLVEANIFEIEIITIKKRSKKIIKVPANIMDIILKTHSVNIPCLHKNNLSAHEQKNHKDIVYMMTNTKFNRGHPSIRLKIKENTVFAQEKPHILYTINTPYLKDIFTMLLEATNYVTNPIEDSGYASLLAYFTALDIDLVYYTSLVQDRKQDPSHSLISQQFNTIINYAIDLNSCNYDTITQDFKTQNKHVYTNIFNQLLPKIMQHKIIFIGVIKECLILSNFKHFFNKGFIDSRGRFYNSSIFTNIQLYPIIKCLVKLYNPNPIERLSKVNFRKLKIIVKDTLTSENCIQSLSQIDFQHYSERKQSLYIDYIFSYFNNNITIETFTNTIINNNEITSQEILTFILNNIKEKKRSLFIHSEILLLKEKSMRKVRNMKHVSNYYELDATASGLQMIAMIFNNKQLAEVCNLIGDEMSSLYDLLKDKSKEYFKHFLGIFDYFVDHNSLEFASKLSVNIYNLSSMKYNSPEATKLLEQLSNNFQSSTNLKSFYEGSITDTLFFSQPEEDFLKKSNYNPFVKFIFWLKYILIFGFNVRFDFNSWLNIETFFVRGLFKQPAMTIFYASTSFGRIQQLIEFMLQYNPVLDITYKVTSFATILEKWFHSFIMERFPALRQLAALTDQLAMRNKDIIIDNNYFYILLDISKFHKKKVQTTRFGKKRGDQVTLLRKGTEKDPQIIKQTFMANFIHSADAFIMATYQGKIMNINKLLRTNEIFARFGVTTNHDNFLNTEPEFLRFLVEDCYYKFAHSNYLESLKKNNEEEIKYNKEVAKKNDEEEVKSNKEIDKKSKKKTKIKKKVDKKKEPFKVSNYQSKEKNLFEKFNPNFIKY